MGLGTPDVHKWRQVVELAVGEENEFLVILQSYLDKGWSMVDGSFRVTTILNPLKIIGEPWHTYHALMTKCFKEEAKG